MNELDTEVKGLEVVIDAECRQLLKTAVSQAFSMLAHLLPSFKLKSLRGPLPPAEEQALVDSVEEEVVAFVKEFGPDADIGGDGVE